MISLPDAIKRVCRETHVPMAQDVFGQEGIDAIFQVMEMVQELYRYVELERVSGEIVVYRRISSVSDSVTIPTTAALDFASLANAVVTTLVLEIAADGRPYAPAEDGVPDEQLHASAVVYRYSAGSETFFAGNRKQTVIRLDPVARSQFCIPSFATLRDALNNYASQSVRESTCYVLSQGWFDGKRLFLKASPESVMRNSLVQFLRNRIGADHEVWPEHRVDESHPVDICVRPRLSNNRLMLIEIKWLGFSVAADGHITARHGESRAQVGANQLAEYLDWQRRFAPTDVIHGYYVIIDARRKDLTEGKTSIDRNDGMFYEDKNLQFDPDHSITRNDFDRPYRMFARPVCE